MLYHKQSLVYDTLNTNNAQPSLQTIDHIQLPLSFVVIAINRFYVA